MVQIFILPELWLHCLFMSEIISVVGFASIFKFIVELDCGAISALTLHYTLQLQIYIFAHKIECVDKFFGKELLYFVSSETLV